MLRDKTSIQAKFLRNMISIALVSIILWCLIWIHGEYVSFKIESASLRVEFIENQKRMLKSEVLNVVKYVRYMKDQTKLKMKVMLKERVYEAHQIALNIYNQNKETKTSVEIGNMIKDALRMIRFHAGRGYYFIGSMDGVDQLYPIKPELEGTNVLNLQDSKGNFVMQDEINIIKKKGEGFVKNFWSKPEKDITVLFPKISFVKYFKPLDWYLGTGEYLDDAKKEIQEDVLKRISDLRFGTEGYFFGSTYGGNSLFSNGKVTVDAGNIWELTDTDGVKIIQEQKIASKKPEGGFVYYSWSKLDRTIPSPKISYVLGISEWEWMVGAGVYLDTIKNKILKKKILLYDGLRKKIISSAFVLLLLLLLIYFWSKRISNQIVKAIETFSLSLKTATIDMTTINLSDLHLREFRDIAELTNKMLNDRKQTEKTLKLKEAQLQQSQKMEVVGVFAGGIAHEFNNLLYIMSGNTELLLDGARDEDKEMLQDIFKSTKKGADLVKQLMAFSRKSESNLYPIQLNSVIQENKNMLDKILPRMIDIRLHLADDLYPIMADRGQIEQVLLNLCLNAKDAMPDGGKLSINTENYVVDSTFALMHSETLKGLKDGRCVILTILDTGCGMDAETKEYIFDPFFTTKDIGKGTGLGLSVIYGIIEGHNGYISCESDLGAGTTFKIYFPAVEDEEQRPILDKNIIRSLSKGTETILIVDDNESIMKMTVKMVEKMGYNAITALNGESALDVYINKQKEVDLILLDLSMPGMGGEKCLKKLIKFDSDVRVLIASGYSETGLIQDSINANAVGFVVKPFTMDYLSKAIRDVLDKD